MEGGKNIPKDCAPGDIFSSTLCKIHINYRQVHIGGFLESPKSPDE